MTTPKTKTTREDQAPARRIDYLALGELVPNPKNPKAHDHTTIDASVGRFGYVEPIVRDERTGLIVSGHGRAEALTAMENRGDTPPDGVHTDPDTGAWLVPVVVGWASHSDTEANAALIAMNRTTELGGWVDDSLLDLLSDLAETEGGFIGVGFGPEDLDALDALANTDSYLDSEEYTNQALAGAVAERRSISITGISDEVWDWWMSLPGDTDAERLIAAMGQDQE